MSLDPPLTPTLLAAAHALLARVPGRLASSDQSLARSREHLRRLLQAGDGRRTAPRAPLTARTAP